MLSPNAALTAALSERHPYRMVIFIPLLVSVAGLLVFLLARSNPDLKKIGEHMMWTGLLATLLTVANARTVAHLLPM